MDPTLRCGWGCGALESGPTIGMVILDDRLAHKEPAVSILSVQHSTCRVRPDPAHWIVPCRPMFSDLLGFTTMNRLVVPSLLLLPFALIPAISQAEYEGMKYRIPQDTNTLILINAEKMFGSQVADHERWEARRKAAYESGISALPPDAAQVILAERRDHELGKSVWELGLVKLTGDRNVTTVAQRFGGAMDEIVGRSAARLPGDHYVIQLMGDLLASYTPANRQDVSRWLRSTDVGAGSTLPPYLEQAFGYATKVGTPIVMAMDMTGVISEAEVRSKIDSFESLKDSGLSADALAKLVSGIQGITLGITLQEDAIGAVRVDFSESPEMLSKVGKSLLIEVLQRQGAMIDDLHDWQPSISGNTFLLRGKLSTDGATTCDECPRTPSYARQCNGRVHFTRGRSGGIGEVDRYPTVLQIDHGIVGRLASKAEA